MFFFFNNIVANNTLNYSSLCNLSRTFDVTIGMREGSCRCKKLTEVQQVNNTGVMGGRLGVDWCRSGEADVTCT